jgi:hypothetical protein
MTYHPLEIQERRLLCINISAVMAEITPEAKENEFVQPMYFRLNPGLYCDRFYVQQRLSKTGRDLSYRTSNQQLEEMVEVVMVYIHISIWPRPTIYHYSVESLNKERAEIIDIFESYFPCITPSEFRALGSAE